MVTGPVVEATLMGPRLAGLGVMEMIGGAGELPNWYAPMSQAPATGLAVPAASKHSAPNPGLGCPLQIELRFCPAPMSGEPASGRPVVASMLMLVCANPCVSPPLAGKAPSSHDLHSARFMYQVPPLQVLIALALENH